ncbi:MAG: tRNA epoxyqueuosine(34) reductase QueG [Phycisphaerales bacterium]|nr:tRNA epoxyqueuosine(34) reductase QueG [Phycisphaerales bacterium]
MPTPDPDQLIQSAKSAGFALAGIATLEQSQWGSQLREWLSESKQGEMNWLANHTDLRIHPDQLIDDAKSALMVADCYASRADNIDPPIEKGQGKIARYARGKDYHKAMKKRLMVLADALRKQHPEAHFKVFVDTAPVLERELALRAGLGWIGKHTLTIHPRIGSYLLLGGIITTLDLSAAAPASPEPDHCGTCTRCIDACPTDAITPYSVDARKCISYLTIEHRTEINPDLQPKIGNWIYGCDICQEVCPHNSPRPDANPANPIYDSTRDRFDLLEVLNWTEDDRRSAFQSSAMKRAKLDMMKRNARIVAANQGLGFNKPE